MYTQAAIDLLGCLTTRRSRRPPLRHAAPPSPSSGSPRSAPSPPTTPPPPLTETLTLFSIALAFYALERWRAAGANYQPLALDHLRRPRLRHPPPPGTRPARRRHSPRHALDLPAPAQGSTLAQTSSSSHPRPHRLPLHHPPAGPLDHPQLAHLPSHPAPRPPLRHRSRRDRPLRLPPLVPHLGHRLRLHRKHLLELRHLRPRHQADLPTAPSTPPASKSAPAALILDYNQTDNATPAIRRPLERHRPGAHPRQPHPLLCPAPRRPTPRHVLPPPHRDARPPHRMVAVEPAPPETPPVSSPSASSTSSTSHSPQWGLWRWKRHGWTPTRPTRDRHDRLHPAPLRPAPHPRQLRAALHPRILSRPTRLGRSRLLPLLSD